jgi:DNA polymerase I-like protein with 3'-5' exonuclease and polymerase domains/5'-3' exonuclease
MTKVAMDMSSYLKTGLLTGKDTKDGRTVLFEGEQVLVNSAEYGYENVTNMMVRTLNDLNLTPKDTILVFEGKSSKSRRLLTSPDYKAKRDKRPPEFYEEFNALKDYIEELWKSMGAIAMSQDTVEADDVLAWLAQETEEDLWLATRDNDIVANSTEGGKNAYGAKVGVWIDGKRDMAVFKGEPFVHPAKYITVYKALVGDDSDNIKGVKGFGPAKFQALAEKYGYDGLDDLITCLDAGDLGPIYPLAEGDAKTACKLVKLILSDEASAIKSWRLAKMYPSWINTMQNPLSIRPGKCSPPPAQCDERLRHWYADTALVTADNYHDVVAFVKAQLLETDEPTFDIETSTPPESDDWVAAIPKAGDMVDQIGSTLTGFSFTFGSNMQYTIYVSVDHADTDNITMVQARELIELFANSGRPIVIHNTMFELGVLYMAEDEDGTLWRDHWKDNGFHGFLPNALDTKMEASYTNENIRNGLKLRSKVHLGYEQQTFEEVTTLEGPEGLLPPGGRLKEVVDEPEGGQRIVRRQYKMRELSAEHVMAYGCDDTICTYALHNYFKLVMMLEHTWRVYLEVELDAAYQHAKNFVDGVDFSLQTMNALAAEDTETFDAAWAVVRSYLLKNGWQGTVPPLYGPDSKVKDLKGAYKIVKGLASKGGFVGEDIMESDDDDLAEEELVVAEADDDEDDEGTLNDPVLKTKVRTPKKLVDIAREDGQQLFAGQLEQALGGGWEKFTAWVQSHFTGEPQFKMSPKQKGKLIYEVMKLPIRVRNKATKAMKAKGIYEGNPKTDALAIEYALRDANPEQKAVLESLKLLQMVSTRRSLYYSKYPYFVHWKTGKIHPGHNQCETNTRRASSSKPNIQQLPKHQKIEGQAARYREVIVPHHPDAVIVSLDFDSQELRVIADYSRDDNMVACFVGDHKKSMHDLTGHGIASGKKLVTITYEEFVIAAKDKSHPLYKVCKEYRALGKKVNFTTEFGAMAEKLAMTLLCSVEEAQAYIDAKEANFPGVRVWKDSVIEESKRIGYVTTKCGARRHLAEIYRGDDYWLKSKAERQSVNFKVQSSSAEMTKKAEGRMWRMGLTFKYDCVCIGPVHDEVVFSVLRKDLEAFIKDAHWCMTQPYGDMMIPILSSISFGPTFGHQAEIGTEPTAEAVAEGWEIIKKMMAEKVAA